ncbi:MAG: TolC family outer membrane protein [Rhodocyclaceae bacterium]|nr:TolC family outer membrane protein [Rhodocyclaceae bacterium]
MLKGSKSLIVGLAVVLPLAGFAQQPTFSLAEAATLAINGNPEIEARWHAFKAAREEQGVARGGFLPQVDLSANLGREWRQRPEVDDRDFSRHGAALTLSQMLYDGLATRSEVSRLGHASGARYYELLDAVENIVLEAARAHHDVLRYRQLVVLAQDNYVQHRQILDQIEQRVTAGVGRRVDLEQASGRLALAEANLLTESSNLHDVSARYQRIVGELPAPALGGGEVPAGAIPPTVNQALGRAYQGSPGLSAARRSMLAAEAEARGKRAAHHPRLDLRAQEQIGFDTDGIDGRHRDRVVELVLSVNLFRGGADSARIRQFAEQMNVARDLRDKTCRDLRQTLAIAYNDITRLGEQLAYLDRHQTSIEKAREAYRRQFDIGQRTLLDLLDTENEYFEARRAYVNAGHDLTIARARTLAAMGLLSGELGLSRAELPRAESLGDDGAGNDISAACPPSAPPVERPDKLALLAAAGPRMRGPQPSAAARPAMSAAPTAPLAGVETRVQAWAAAWSARDVGAYLDFYSSRFDPGGDLSRASWESMRRRLVGRAGPISVRVDDLVVRPAGPDRAIAEFRQDYASADYRDAVTKRLEWGREGGQWRILSERTD